MKIQTRGAVMIVGRSESLPVRTILVDVEDSEMGTNAFDKAIFDAVRNQKMLEQEYLQQAFPRFLSPLPDASIIY
jgi:hypothetical protein